MRLVYCVILLKKRSTNTIYLNSFTISIDTVYFLDSIIQMVFLIGLFNFQQFLVVHLSVDLLECVWGASQDTGCLLAPRWAPNEEYFSLRSSFWLSNKFRRPTNTSNKCTMFSAFLTFSTNTLLNFLDSQKKDCLSENIKRIQFLPLYLCTSTSLRLCTYSAVWDYHSVL